ncbi:TrmH family RNA methyltransferase [Microbacterium sp. NPDC058342]|uniref:TrmH family RNA methyltransferase n=1 Tax=Microbacterium sp. NPDC058342 TaxID=3346454 RepID=UPI003656A19D
MADALSTAKHSPLRRVVRAEREEIGRIADVLRSGALAPRVVLIDDPENIEQAIACDVHVDALYATERMLEQGLPRLRGAAHDEPFRIIDAESSRRLFRGQKDARVFALARAPRPLRPRDLLKRPGDVLVLDGVRLVGNIGAVTRTAGALGAAGVILVDSGLRSITDRRLIRASRGLVFSVPVVLAGRAECVDFLSRERLQVATLSAGAAEPLDALREVTGRLALVLGSERHGVSRQLDKITQHRCAIPMTADAESLNVSVAAGIALYERHQVRDAAGRAL